MANTVVNIIGPNSQVEEMFLKRDFTVISSMTDDCDLVCFTGGEDITPFLYGEEPLSINGVQKTFFNPTRDMREIKAYRTYEKIPKVGICRGGQLLNVLSGGSMYQHVDNHTNNHQMEYIDRYTKGKDGNSVPVWKSCEVSSTHHQQMIPGYQGNVIGRAGLSNNKYTPSRKYTYPTPDKYMMDAEIIYYWATESLCFQPHPEYSNDKCQDLFFDLIKGWLNVSNETKR